MSSGERGPAHAGGNLWAGKPWGQRTLPEVLATCRAIVSESAPTTGKLWSAQTLIRARMSSLGRCRSARDKATASELRRMYWAISRRVSAGEFGKRARQLAREHYQRMRV